MIAILWGDWLSCDPLRGPHDSRSPPYRKNRGLSTYIAHIDSEKAFDRVDCDLLLYKLLNIGIGGKMYDIIKYIYTGTSLCVNVNGFMTKYFQSKNGLQIRRIRLLYLH